MSRGLACCLWRVVHAVQACCEADVLLGYLFVFALASNFYWDVDWVQYVDVVFVGGYYCDFGREVLFGHVVHVVFDCVVGAHVVHYVVFGDDDVVVVLFYALVFVECWVFCY